MGRLRGGGEILASRVILAGVAAIGALLCSAVVGRAQESEAPRAQAASDSLKAPKTPLQLVRAMVTHEDDEQAHRDQYEFLTREQSERTKGQVWTERVVETAQGRVRMLLAVGGTPLNAAQEQAERARLAAIITDPAEFLAREKSQRDEEANARKMLDMLPRAFLFDHVRLQNGVWRMDYHPDPAYTPHGIQERVLYGMSGSVAIDEQQQRLMEIEGELRKDVSIGFGLLATVHAGSRFSSQRSDEDGHWRTVHVVTDIKGKAGLFKSVGRNSDVTRSDFVYLQPGITLAQAVALVESPARTATMKSSTNDGH